MTPGRKIAESETWEADAGTLRMPAWQGHPVFADFQPWEHVANEDDCARARLAASAPEMARLLLEAEWGGGVQAGIGDGRDPACPWCQNRDDMGHSPRCEWVETLRGAGVLE